MSEIYTEGARKTGFQRRLPFIIIALTGLGAAFFMFRGCSDISPESANLVLETKGKVYLHSLVSAVAVEASIAKKESPAAMMSLGIYTDDEHYFVQPGSMQSLVDVMAGNVNLHDYKEVSYDGYVTSASDTIYMLETSYKSTATIGEQLTVFTARLRNADGEDMIIQWELNPKTGEAKPVSNCELHSFWIQTNPSPGETVISSEDFLVVAIEDLSSFFGCESRYDEENQVLFITR